MANFLSVNGRILFIGDANTNFASQNARINAALSSLNSSMALGNNALDSGYKTTTNIANDPFTQNVTSFTYGFTNSVSGGTTLISSIGFQPIVTFEIVAVPEPSSMALAGIFVMGFAARNLRKKPKK